MKYHKFADDPKNKMNNRRASLSHSQHWFFTQQHTHKQHRQRPVYSIPSPFFVRRIFVPAFFSSGYFSSCTSSVDAMFRLSFFSYIFFNQFFVYFFGQCIGIFVGNIFLPRIFFVYRYIFHPCIFWRIASMNFTTAFTGRQHAALIRSILL